MLVPMVMRDVRPAMPATVVSASLLNTPSTMKALSHPSCSACTARSTASRTPTSNPQIVSPIFMPGLLGPPPSGAARAVYAAPSRGSVGLAPVPLGRRHDGLGVEPVHRLVERAV